MTCVCCRPLPRRQLLWREPGTGANQGSSLGSGSCADGHSRNPGGKWDGGVVRCWRGGRWWTGRNGSVKFPRIEISSPSPPPPREGMGGSQPLGCGIFISGQVYLEPLHQMTACLLALSVLFLIEQSYLTPEPGTQNGDLSAGFSEVHGFYHVLSILNPCSDRHGKLRNKIKTLI